jgi:hypothetical protein
VVPLKALAKQSLGFFKVCLESIGFLPTVFLMQICSLDGVQIVD